MEAAQVELFNSHLGLKVVSAVSSVGNHIVPMTNTEGNSSMVLSPGKCETPQRSLRC